MKQMTRDLAWEIPEDLFTYEHFRKVVSEVDMQSTPGYPYCLDHPTNQAFFHAKDGEIPDERAREIFEMVKQRINNKGTADPIRLFIKPEPTKLRKLEEKRTRLISSVSIIDQIYDAMLFVPMNNVMINNYHTTPIKVGWSPYVGGWREIPQVDVQATDKSSWDWVVFAWLLELELEWRSMMCKTTGTLKQIWLEHALHRYSELFISPLFITSGGMLLRQRFPGIMKSGCINTITTNSAMQLLLHIRVCLLLGIPIGFISCMGDDTLQEAFSREFLTKYLTLLAQFCNIKETTHKAEFAGMEYIGHRCEPVYFGKHAFNLLHAAESNIEQLAASYALLYHRSKKRGFIRGLFEELQLQIPDFAFLDAIFDGE